MLPAQQSLESGNLLRIQVSRSAGNKRGTVGARWPLAIPIRAAADSQRGCAWLRRTLHSASLPELWLAAWQRRRPAADLRRARVRGLLTAMPTLAECALRGLPPETAPPWRENSFRDPHRVAGIGNSFQQDGEFISSHARKTRHFSCDLVPRTRNGVFVPQAVSKRRPISTITWSPIAVAHGVVERLKTVQIDEQDGVLAIWGALRALK